MDTNIKRKRKDGSTSWLAQIANRRAGKSVFRENRTFERRSIAAAWLQKRKKDLAKPSAQGHRQFAREWRGIDKPEYAMPCKRCCPYE